MLVVKQAQQRESFLLQQHVVGQLWSFVAHSSLYIDIPMEHIAYKKNFVQKAAKSSDEEAGDAEGAASVLFL